MYDGPVDHHVVVQKFSRSCRVGKNPANRAGNEKYVFWAIRTEPVVDCGLVAKVKLITISKQQVRMTRSPESLDDGRANESGMTCYEYSGILGERGHRILHGLGEKD